MWIFRELFRFVWMIAVTVAIAAVVGALWALISSGGVIHHLRIAFFVFGALLVLLAGAGNQGTASARRSNWGIMNGFSRGPIGALSPPVRSRSGDPTLTASAVFVGSGLVLIVLGLLV